MNKDATCNVTRESRMGAYGLCVRHEQILLIKKAKGPYKGTLDLPGGGIEFGEAPTETVVREFIEETGQAVTVQTLVGTYSKVSTFPADAGNGLIELHHLGLIYVVSEPTTDQPLRTQADGLDSLGAVWISLADLAMHELSLLAQQGIRFLPGLTG